MNNSSNDQLSDALVDPSKKGAMLRVLLVFSTADVGGAERSLTRMAFANRDSGVTYSFSTLAGEGEWSSWVRAAGKKPILFDVTARSFPRACRRIVREVRQLKADVIYAIGLRACSLVRLLKPLLAGVLVVHGIRTSFPRGWALTRRYAWVEGCLGWLTDAYIANSSIGAETLSRITGRSCQEIHVVPNGINVVEQVLPPISSRKPVVAIVANLHPLKGHLKFLPVMEMVMAAVPGVRFDIIGRDEMDGAVQRAIALHGLSRVTHFWGFQRDVLPFLANARVFVLPSQLTEGMSTAILEAQSIGLPVVAYAVGGTAQLVNDRVDGRLIAVGQDGEMAQAIITLLLDERVAIEMGERARHKATTEFSMAACAEKHARIWRHLCGLQGAGG